MRRRSGWPATGVGLVSVTLEMAQPSVAQVQEACNVALAHGVRADSLSLAEKSSQLQIAGPRQGSSSCDGALDAVRAPPLGAHMVTPGRGYTHHGIYVGGGRVVQYGGLCGWLRRGPVEEVVLSQFAQGRPIYIRPAQSPLFDQDEVVRRARSRLGENSYNLLTNNCEHFCEWCLHGEHRSYQVDEFLARCGRFWRRVIELIAGETSPAGACAERSA